MDIKDLKHAETLLINSTHNEDIKNFIDDKVETWSIPEFNDYLDVISKLKELFLKLYEEIFQEDEDEINTEALQWIVFHKIHDAFLPCMKARFYNEDLIFFEKCKSLCDMKVSAEQFGADENYTIPLSAAIVELSIIDIYKSPIEKMNCLCSTYDLVFAEIKTAIVSMISQNSEKENQIPIINNTDVIPVLMVVIIKSKLLHVFSNLFYIKTLYHNLEEKRIVFDIFKAFETAVDKLRRLDIKALQPVTGKIIRTIDLEEYIRMTSFLEEEINNKTLVDEANERIINLITRSTSEDQLY